jgi:antitoxin (DNA-binding transcriptional repressor) of toxin-antitoxin stability system
MEVSVSSIRKEEIILEALRRVRLGERVIITRRRVAVAQLVSLPPGQKASRRRA